MWAPAVFFGSHRYALIQVPVADVRSSSASISSSYDYDPKEETQVLYGEKVEIIDVNEGDFWHISGDWIKIRAMEQLEFTHDNSWMGYPGWVKREAVYLTEGEIPEPKLIVKNKMGRLYNKPRAKSSFIPLSMGTKLVDTGVQENGFWQIKTVWGKKVWIPMEDVQFLTPLLSEEFARKMIIENASQLIGDPYFWGGRSAHISELKGFITAVDCSGLTNLAYRVAGIDLPRDSFEQHLKGKKINKENLKPGDLIFSAPKDNPEKVSHVSIFIDSSTLLEAPQTGLNVRKISFKQKYGVPFDKIQEGIPTGDRVLYFGTYFGKN